MSPFQFAAHPLKWVALFVGVCTVTPALSQGHHANATARAAVYALPGFADLDPWVSEIRDGFGFNTFQPNTAALAANPGGTALGKTVSSTAYANLATGKLGVATSVVNSQATAGSAGQSVALATFGDSFTFANTSGGAFQWSPNNAVSFGIAVSGFSLNTSSTTFLDWSVWLTIYSAGTLAGAPSTWDSGNLGGGVWTGNRQAGGNAITFFNGQPGPIGFAGAFTGALNAGTLNLSASFMPGANFDWSMGFYSAAGALSTQLGSQTADLLNTASVAFYQPAGAVTLSSSGVFPGTSPVPENGTLAMTAVGLLATAWRVRQRR